LRSTLEAASIEQVSDSVVIGHVPQLLSTLRSFGDIDYLCDQVQ
jgi:hypothetical protein